MACVPAAFVMFLWLLAALATVLEVAVLIAFQYAQRMQTCTLCSCSLRDVPVAAGGAGSVRGGVGAGGCGELEGVAAVREMARAPRNRGENQQEQTIPCLSQSELSVCSIQGAKLLDHAPDKHGAAQQCSSGTLVRNVLITELICRLQTADLDEEHENSLDMETLELVNLVGASC